MSVVTREMQRLDGGLDVKTDATQLEKLEGPLRTPDCLNVVASVGAVETRCGCQQYADLGSAAVYWFSLFSPRKYSSAGAAATLSGGALTYPSWTWPTLASRFRRRRRRHRKQKVNRVFLLDEPNGELGTELTGITVAWTNLVGNNGYHVIVHTSRTRTGAPTQALVAAKDAVTADITAALDYYTTYYVWVFAIVPMANGSIVLVPATGQPNFFKTKLKPPGELTPSGTIDTLTPTLRCELTSGPTSWVFKIYRGGALVHTSEDQPTNSYAVPEGVLEHGTAYTFTVTVSDGVVSATSAAGAFATWDGLAASYQGTIAGFVGIPDWNGASIMTRDAGAQVSFTGPDYPLPGFEMVLSWDGLVAGHWALQGAGLTYVGGVDPQDPRGSYTPDAESAAWLAACEPPETAVTCVVGDAP